MTAASDDATHDKSYRLGWQQAWQEWSGRLDSRGTMRAADIAHMEARLVAMENYGREEGSGSAMPPGGPCGRDGCGANLICCRPDCPLVLVEVETGLHCLTSRSQYLADVMMLARDLLARTGYGSPLREDGK